MPGYIPPDSHQDLRNGLRVSANRHYSTQHMAVHFAFGHLPEELQNVSRQFAECAQWLVDHLVDGPELTVALRHLWDAKNSAVLHAGFLNGLQQPMNDSFTPLASPEA